jgi:hypothetical protein
VATDGPRRAVAGGVSVAGGLPSLTGSPVAGYVRHPLHAATRAYAESNCYTDVIIELLHARGLEPLAVFGHLVRMDFEGDQWTFFKPPPEDLERLYGVDIHEMQPYRPLPVQIAEQLRADRTLIVELDSWYLPDTAGTSYRTEHVKSSVAADAIDPDRETLRYFHGPALWELSGEDYRGVFRIGVSDPEVLPPYTELARFDAGDALVGEALRVAAHDLVVHHLRRRPQGNPFTRFGESLERQQDELLAGDLAGYHAYAFATVRMAGSSIEILGDHVRWLLGDTDAAPVTEPLQTIVDGCKALSFRMARRRRFDPAPRIDELAQAWERALELLQARAG